MFKNCFRSVFVFFFITLLGGMYLVNAQEVASSTEAKGKIITKEPYFQEHPVVINTGKVGETAFDFSKKPVEIEQSDWLKAFNLNVKNLTKKKIIYLSFNITFPDTAANGLNIMALQPRFGQTTGFTRDGKPLIMRSAVTRKNPLVELEPSKEFNISLEEDYESLVRFIESRQPMSTIKKVHVSFSMVGFEDGTFWSYGGYYFKYDQDNPGQQIKLPVPELLSQTAKSF